MHNKRRGTVDLLNPALKDFGVYKIGDPQNFIEMYKD